MPKNCFVTATMLFTMLFGIAQTAYAAKRPPANVPPTLEIEVLDPNADSQGRPAVELVPTESGELAVDIPPAVLVHRYYYSGDRSFQAQLLPGGPCIVVADHPNTGERCYIPVQMMPGAPRVTYTKHGIHYDYGEHGIAITFGWLGAPTVKYRSGTTWRQKLATVLHSEDVHAHTTAAIDRTKNTMHHSSRAMKGAIVEVGDFSRQALLPVQNTLQILPLGKIVFSSDLCQRLEERAAEHERDHERRRLQRENERNAATFRTIR